MEEILDIKQSSIRSVSEHVLYEASTDFPFAAKRVPTHVHFNIEGMCL